MMDRELIRKHCDEATKIVLTWPEWERNLIENSLRPCWDRARELVLEEVG